MESKVVKVDVKDGYGQIRFYPTNKLGWLFADLSGKRTFTLTDLRVIKELGFKIEPNYCTPRVEAILKELA